MKDINLYIKFNNRGMSFIEIIVVVLIVGILATSVTLSVGVINNPKTIDAAKKISSVLDKARLETMSRMDDEIVVSIFEEDDKYYASIITEGENPSSDDSSAVYLGGKGIKLLVKDLEVQDENIEIKFDRSTGSFDTGNNIFTEGSAEICVQGKDEVKVVLVERTGRNYIE